METILRILSGPKGHRAGVSSAILLALSLTGCGTTQHARSYRGIPCDQIEARIDFDNRIETLNILSEGFYYRCFDEVIVHGKRARDTFRHKTFSITRETGNIFLPEETLIEYVMESYERGFLSFLIAASYQQKNDPQGAKIELRRMDDELKAGLYNYGEDPVNILLQAILWEHLKEPDEARVDWRNIQEQDQIDEVIQAFATEQIRLIDDNMFAEKRWKVFAIGRFPEITWDLKFVNSDSGYFSVQSVRPFLTDCASETGLRISTRSWMNKIAMRHDDGYHPLVNARTWIRLPVGIAYSITTFSSGAALIIGGCAADAYGGGDGALCLVSVKGGAALMGKSPKVLNYTLKPDFRHWENVPESFLFTRADSPEEEFCLGTLPRNTLYHEIFW
jgi:hypothetical protein